MTIRGLLLVAACVVVGLGAIATILTLAEYFEHHQDPHDLMTLVTKADIRSACIREVSGRTIWRIEASPPRPLSHLEYGVVPPGFVQAVPAGGLPPRPFVPQERLQLVVMTSEGTFVHDGAAADARGFRGGVSTFTPGLGKN